MEHEHGITLDEAQQLSELVRQRLRQIAELHMSAASGLRAAANELETVAKDLRERANSVGLPYPPDEA
jgi:hypothetical protein